MALAGKFAGLLGSNVMDPRLTPQFDTVAMQPEYLVANAAVPGNSRVVNRAVRFGETNQSNVPGVSALGGKDPTNGWAINAIEAGGRFLPLVGAAWLGINAGPTADYDTLNPASVTMRQRMMNR